MYKVRHSPPFNNKDSRFALLSITSVLVFFILYTTGGRAGCIGLMVALLIYFQRFATRKYIRLGWIILVLSIIGLVFLAKSDSSHGHWLIYKVLIKELPLEYYVNGGGSFRAIYNPLQAKYFATRGLQNREINTADETYFLFNDPLQLILQSGLIWTVLFLLIALIVYLYRPKGKIVIDLSDDRQAGAILSLIVRCVSSFFNYTFQVITILPMFGLMWGIFTKVPETKINRGVSIASQWNLPMLVLRQFFFASIAFLTVAYSFIQYGIVQSKRLSDAGYKNAAINHYTRLDSFFIKDERIFYPFARELFYLGRDGDALNILTKASNFLYDSHTAWLFGKIFLAKRDLQNAEKYFLQAVYINPKSFRNRYLLFQFYLDTKQKVKSIFWGYSILKLKPKINSPIVEQIKLATKSKLELIH